MFQFILAFLFFRSRSDTPLEVLALRQQVAVLKRKRPRPILHRLDRFFWTSLRRCWPRWAEVLVIRLIIAPQADVRIQGAIRRRSRLGGMLNYYYRPAA